MNRILEIIQRPDGKKHLIPSDATPIQQRRYSVTQTPDNAPGRCCFCAGLLSSCGFVAYTRIDYRPTGALCDRCIINFSRPAKFVEINKVYGQKKPDYSAWICRLIKRLVGENGSQELKSKVIELILRFAIRQSAIVHGCVFGIDPKTGVDLSGRLRIAVITNEVEELANLIRLACDEVGLHFRHCTSADVSSGKGFKDLVCQQTNREEAWAAFAVMFCNGYVETQANCILVFACKSEAGLPAEVVRVVINK